MKCFSRAALRRVPGAVFAPTLAVLAWSLGDAQAQGRLEVSYTISVARIPIGNMTLVADIGDSEYMISANGRVSGAMRVLASGESSSIARGLIKDGSPVPMTFTSKAASGNENLEVKMVLDDGNVKELDAKPPSQDRVPVTEAHRQSIIDPLTAMLTPTAGEGLIPQVCQRTLAIFDGYQRYDLKVTFKRMDTLKAAQGYDGPVVVCSATHHPIAGHRTSDPLVNFLAGREIEATLAPVVGVRVMAPVRLSVASMLANLEVTASTAAQ